MLAHKCDKAIMENTQKPVPQTSSRKHKGGRPKKDEAEKHTVCKKVYFTVEQSKAVEAAADDNRMSDSEYINEMTMNGQVVAPVSEDFARDFRSVANMGGNINQLAHQANKEGYHSVAKEMLDELPKLKAVLNQIYICL